MFLAAAFIFSAAGIVKLSASLIFKGVYILIIPANGIFSVAWYQFCFASPLYINEMKLKIRKVEATPEEFFERISSIMEVYELVKGHDSGIPLKYLYRQLGIKEMEFWMFAKENEEKFFEKYKVERPGILRNKYFV